LQSLEDGAFRGIHSIEVELFTLEESSQPVISMGELGAKVVLRRREEHHADVRALKP
jgi:hypothetical protein